MTLRSRQFQKWVNQVSPCTEHKSLNFWFWFLLIFSVSSKKRRFFPLVFTFFKSSTVFFFVHNPVCCFIHLTLFELSFCWVQSTSFFFASFFLVTFDITYLLVLRLWFYLCQIFDISTYPFCFLSNFLLGLINDLPRSVFDHYFLTHCVIFFVSFSNNHVLLS